MQTTEDPSPVFEHMGFKLNSFAGVPHTEAKPVTRTDQLMNDEWKEIHTGSNRIMSPLNSNHL